MKTIWKYELLLSSSNQHEIVIPKDAKILTVQTHKDELCIWALVETDNPKTVRQFRVYGTGQMIINPNRLEYVATTQQMGGALVWHVFEWVAK